MSNLSVLERLETALAEYEQGKMSRAEFVTFLTNSIEALEAIPYNVLLELRTHEYSIETEGYFDEEGFDCKSVAAKEELRVWLQRLKETYDTGNC